MSDTIDPKPTILIVDDVYSDRTLLAKILETEYQVEQAQNGIEALEKLRALPNIAVVVLDILMPGLDGFEVMEAMSKEEKLQNIPVIINTAMDDLSDQIRALDAGATNVLVKPYNAQVVLSRVHNILVRKESEKKAVRAHMLEELLRLADIDEKTGINNKRGFCRETRKMLLDNPLGRYLLIRWDIDHFKVYNDTFGVDAGDQLLGYIGELYKERATARMTFGHWNADHFVMCMRREDFEDHNVVELLANFSDELHDGFQFVARAGIYVVDDPGLDVNLMSDRAALALSSIKNSYSTHVAYYDNSMRDALLEEQALVGEMHRALEEGQFIIYLQPQVNYVSGKLFGAEALVRWQHPDKGLLLPGNFIQIFEKNGFISEVDAYVRETVCKLLKKWQNSGLPIIPISVNVSRRDLCDPRLCERIVTLTDKYEISPEWLIIEITETAYMENAQQLLKTVNRLRAYGFMVQMDDFGSGYSSLNTLREVPVDMLKLDMQFLQNSGQNTKGGSILTSVIRMANWIQLPVIAEGVETRNQAEYLKSIGCIFMQGYYFSRPIPVQEYEKLLDDCSIEPAPRQVFTNNIDGATEFLTDSTQATLIFNSFVGGAAIIESWQDNVEALRLNDKFFEVLGTTREEFADKQTHFLDCLDLENRRNFLVMILRAIDSGDEDSTDLRLEPLTEGGDDIWVNARIRLLARNDNRFILYMTIENITERVKLSEKISTIIGNVPGGIFDLELSEDKLRTIYFNDMAARMFGYTRQQFEELFGADSLSAVHPDDWQMIEEKIKRIKIEREQSFRVEYRHKCANGSWRWVRMNARVKRRKPTQIYISSIVMDIHDELSIMQTAASQKQELEHQRLEMKAVYDTIPCGVVQFIETEDGDVMDLLSFNDAAWKILGFDSRAKYSETVRGRSKLDDCYTEDLPKIRECMEKARKGNDGDSAELDHRVKRMDGEIIWVHSTYQKVIFPNGKTVTQCCFYHINKPDDTRLVQERPLSTQEQELQKEIVKQKNRLRQVTERMKNITSNLPAGLIVYTVTDKILPIFVNDKVCELFGRTRQEYELCITNGEAIDFTPDLSQLREEFAKQSASSSRTIISKQLMHKKDGTEFWARVHYTLHKEDDDTLHCYTVLSDITDEILLEQQTMWQAEKFRILSEESDLITFDYSPSQDVMVISIPWPGKGLITDIRENYLSSFASYGKVSENEKKGLSAALKKASSKALHGVYNFSGDFYGSGAHWYRATYVSLEDESGQVYRVIGRLDDIDDLIRTQEQLRENAIIDDLTGLFNKSYAVTVISQALNQLRVAHFDAMLFLDLDNFKQLNDSYGHLEADQILKQVGAVLRQQFRSEDILSRFGGDEFVIFMRSAGTLEMTTKKAQDVIDAINKIKVGTDDYVHCSIGITCIPVNGISYQTAIKRADLALYEAKEKGKNQYAVYTLPQVQKEDD